MKTVKSHNRSKEKEREVEVVFQEVGEGVVALFPVTVLQGKAHAAHDAEATASIEQDVLQVKRSGHQGLLQGESAIPELQAQKLYIGCRDVSVLSHFIGI